MTNWVTRFETQVSHRGRETAIISEGDYYTYNELNDHGAQLANYFDEHDIERTALYFPNIYEVMPVHIGGLKAGAESVPINYMFETDSIEYVLDDADPDAVFALADDADIVSEAMADTDVDRLLSVGDTREADATFSEIIAEYPSTFETVPQEQEDIFYIGYTSGTTGQPKGVIRTHGNLHAQFLKFQHFRKLKPHDLWINAGPLFHGTGMEGASFSVLQTGASVIIHDWDVEEFFHEIDEYGPDAAYIAGSMLADIYEYEDYDSWDVSSLKHIFTGGAPMDHDQCDTIESRLDAVVSERMGMSEAGLVFGYYVGDPTRYTNREEVVESRVRGSVGKLLHHGAKARLIDLETDEPVGVGEGALQLKGESVFDRYLKKPEKTDEVFTEDGWYVTGDLMERDEDGYFYHRGRADNVIITGGENVSPDRVEDVLENHPDIKEGAVFPLPDSHWGQRVCAAVIATNETLTEEDLIQYFKDDDELATFEVPKQIFFRDSFPRTATGTVQRKELTEQYAEA